MTTTMRYKRKATAAYAASLIAKADPGNVVRIRGYNSGAAQFLQLHDSATLPADTAVPASVMAIAATSNFDFDLKNTPIPCIAGIVVCNSSTAMTKTIGSANCHIEIFYE